MYWYLGFLALLCLAYVLIAVIWPKGKDTYRNKVKDESAIIFVEHVICMRNEARFAKEKIKNCLEIDYPYMRHTIVDDASDDDTFAVLTECSKGADKIKVIRNSEPLGKYKSQISVCEAFHAKKILFTDANVFLSKDAVKELLSGFSDQKVGLVTGNVTITTDYQHRNLWGKYWDMEKRIKEFQNLSGAVIGVDGGLYCLSAEVFHKSHIQEPSDFLIAFSAFSQGKLVRYIKSAKATELEKRRLKASLTSRVRVSNQTSAALIQVFRQIFNFPLPVQLHLIFHKVVRYLFILSYVICLPFILIQHPYLGLFLFIPIVSRFTIEAVAVFWGALLALFGKKYTLWSDKK